MQKELGDIFGRKTDTTLNRAVNLMGDKAKTAVKRGIQGISFAPEQMFRIGAMRAYMEHLQRTGKLNVKNWNDADNMHQALQADEDVRARLIQATKDITTNFERKGTANSLRAFYVFFNAAMQGMFRTVPQIMASEHGRKYTMILGGLLFMQAFYS